MTNQISRNTRYIPFKQMEEKKEEREKKEYEPSILSTKIYDMILYSNNKLLQYPRYEKYQLVRDMKACMDKMLECSIELERKNARKTTIRTLDITNAKLQYYVRLSFEVKKLNWHDNTIKDETTDEEIDRTTTKTPPAHSKLKSGYIDSHTYDVWSQKLEEIGRIIGGIIKADERREQEKRNSVTKK